VLWSTSSGEDNIVWGTSLGAQDDIKVWGTCEASNQGIFKAERPC
jgi:hypothetical protein